MNKIVESYEPFIGWIGMSSFRKTPDWVRYVLTDWKELEERKRLGWAYARPHIRRLVTFEKEVLEAIRNDEL